MRRERAPAGGRLLDEHRARRSLRLRLRSLLNDGDRRLNGLQRRRRSRSAGAAGTAAAGAGACVGTITDSAGLGR